MLTRSLQLENGQSLALDKPHGHHLGAVPKDRGATHAPTVRGWFGAQKRPAAGEARPLLHPPLRSGGGPFFRRATVRHGGRTSSRSLYKERTKSLLNSRKEQISDLDREHREQTIKARRAEEHTKRGYEWFFE